ncbi:MAG: hypothetical protein MUF80_10880, partial [Burkholderiales bacterium]|nr:hypothetical protein [Burkholderiales bacterium]
MDNPRIFLWIGLALLAWMNVVQWNRDYGSAPSATAPAATAPAATGPEAQAEAGRNQLPSLPSGAPAPAATDASAGTAPT